MKATTIINCCAHEVAIKVGDTILRLPPCGVVPRAVSKRVVIGEVNGIPINAVEFGDVENMPAPAVDTIYIVSKICAEALRGVRDDVYITDGVVKDESGAPAYCAALSKL